MTAWSILGGAALGTLMLRASFITFLGDREMPDTLTRALRYVPAAVLAALVAPAVLQPEGQFDLTNLRLPAAIVAGLVAWRTRNMAYTLVVGMVALWFAQAVS